MRRRGGPQSNIPVSRHAILGCASNAQLRGSDMITTIGRRSLLTALGAATASSLLRPLAARAQRLFKIGMLYTGGVDAFFTAAFMRKLGELGYAEGKNVVIARKSADGDIERLKDFAADLVAQRVDVIVTMG